MYVQTMLCSMKVQSIPKIWCNFKIRNFLKYIFGAKFNGWGSPYFAMESEVSEAELKCNRGPNTLSPGANE